MSTYIACLLAAVASVSAQVPAFPGAEGAGANTPGGRGGDVYHVTNLDDSGPGSLRAGITTAAGPRTVVFDISGTIQLKARLPIDKPFLTIAGQTAPGDGITVAGWTTSVTGTHDVVVRYMRFRAGDINCPAYQDDAFDVDKSTNVIIDHVSSSWSVDETLSVTESDKVTVQWSFVTESMKSSCHEKGEHGYGTLMRYGSGTYTLHHNLYAHHQSRNPRIGDDLSVDFVNNVIYDHGSEGGYSGPADEGTTKINYVGNYIVAGPSTAASRRTRAFLGGSDNTQIWQSGNLIDSNGNGRRDGTDTGWAMFTNPLTRRQTRFDLVPTNLDDAATAYTRVLASAGASLVRDAVDQRIVDEVQNDKGKLIDSQKDVGGWPALNSRKAPLDTDQDGIPDVWEVTHGLNPTDPRDGAAALKGAAYTNLEAYLNDLVAPPAVFNPYTIFDTSFEDAQSKFLFNGRATSIRTDEPGSVSFDLTATAANSEAFWAYFTEPGKPVTLGVGDKLTVSLDFSTQGFARNGSDVRFGVLDSLGTRNTANLTGGMNDSTFVGDTGYALDYFASGTGSPFVLARRSVLSTANVFNSFGDFTPIPGTGASTRQSLADATRYTLTYTIERQSATTTALSVSVTGGDLAELSYAAVENNPSPNTTFDYFAFRIGGTNFSRTVTFHRMRVDVQPAPPAITLQPQPALQTVQIGQTIEYVVSASGTGLSFEWFRNDQLILSGSPRLSLGSVKLTDSGTYTAVVSNRAGRVISNPVVLRVSVDPVAPPPTITSQPSSLKVTVGGGVSFFVAAEGDNVQYQWFHNEVPIPGATAGQLRIATAAYSDAGIYYAVVSSTSGTVVSSGARLDVLSKQRLIRRAPANMAMSVCQDVSLVMEFDGPVKLGKGGIVLFTYSDPRPGYIDAGARSYQMLIGGTPYNVLPAVVSGNKVTVPLRLGPNRLYSLGVQNNFVTDAEGGPIDIEDWSFTTGPEAKIQNGAITVAADGSGDVCTVQAAIDLVPANNTKSINITVEPGTYNEIDYIPSNKPFITLRGADRATTVIQYPNNANLNAGNQRAMFGVDAADFTLEDITLRNTTPKGGSQAEALRTNNARTTINRVSFYSYQDTLFLNGQVFVTDSYIEGDVDFMWGNGTVFFRNSELRAITSGGYYTQIRNTQTQKGNVYVNCRLTAPDGVTGVYLARIDPGVFPYSQVVWIDSVMGPHIHPAGWLLNNATAAPNVQFWEYNSLQPDGTLVNTSQRLTASRQLTETEAARWRDPAFVLDGWLPYTVNAAGNGPTATVNWTAPPGHNEKDWIGLYEVGAPDSAYISWQYTGPSHQGRMTLAVPSSGNYELRMYLADDFRVRVATVNITR